MPLGHKGYFELRAAEEEQPAAELPAHPVCLKAGCAFPLYSAPLSPQYQDRKTAFIKGDGGPTEVRLHRQTLLIFHRLLPNVYPLKYTAPQSPTASLGLVISARIYHCLLRRLWV